MSQELPLIRTMELSSIALSKHCEHAGREDSREPKVSLSSFERVWQFITILKGLFLFLDLSKRDHLLPTPNSRNERICVYDASDYRGLAHQFSYPEQTSFKSKTYQESQHNAVLQIPWPRHSSSSKSSLQRLSPTKEQPRPYTCQSRRPCRASFPELSGHARTPLRRI